MKIGTFGLVVTVSIALLQPAQGRPSGGGARSFSPGYHFSGSAGHYSGRSAGFSHGGGGYYRSGSGYYRSSPRMSSHAVNRSRAHAPAGSRAAVANRTAALNPRSYSTSGSVTQGAAFRRNAARAGGVDAQAAAFRRNAARAAGVDAQGRLPAQVTSGWDQNCDHHWRGYRCRYYNNAWVIIDPWFWWGLYPWAYGYYGYGYPYGGYYYDEPYYEDYPAGYSDYDTGYGDASVREVQAALARKGYYHGAIDGSFGPATRNAVRQYQLNHGLEVTGQIDQSVIAKLGLRRSG